MSKITQNYEQLAVANGLRFDGARNVLYGSKNGYEIMIYAGTPSYPYILTVALGAKSPMGMLDKAQTKQFVKENKDVASLSQDGNMVKMVLKNIAKQSALSEGLGNSIGALTSYLRSKGFEPCCQFCGQLVGTAGYEVSGSFMHLCPDCAGRLRQDMTLSAKQKQQKSENVIGGIVGALLGSLIGILCIVFFGQLDRVAAVSGVIMAVCTIKGYELLGGKFTKKGVVISIIVMVAMTYVGNALTWVVAIVREIGADFFTVVQYLPMMLEEGLIEKSAYWYNLVLLYVFTLLGAVPTVHANLKERRQESSFGQIGSYNNF